MVRCIGPSCADAFLEGEETIPGVSGVAQEALIPVRNKGCDFFYPQYVLIT